MNVKTSYDDTGLLLLQTPSDQLLRKYCIVRFLLEQDRQEKNNTGQKDR